MVNFSVSYSTYGNVMCYSVLYGVTSGMFGLMASKLVSLYDKYIIALASKEAGEAKAWAKALELGAHAFCLVGLGVASFTAMMLVDKLRQDHFKFFK